MSSSPKTEQLPNTNELTKIKTNIDDIKKSVQDLKLQIENFDKAKNDLTQEIVQQKQKEIEEKKLEIEKKKKETQELIQNAKELEELKADITSQQELQSLEKELAAIDPVKSSFREKIKEGGNKTRERITEHKKPILIATGIGAGILLLRHWLKKRKAKKEGTEEKSEKKEKKSRWKKALLWAGIGTGGFLVWKNWSKIKGRFSKDNKEGGGDTDSVKDSPQEFYEKLTPGEKATYNKLADNINGFYQSGAGEYNSELKSDLLGNASFESYNKENIPGVVPFMINNRYPGNNGIDDFLSEGTFYREIVGVKSQNIASYIQKRSADKIGAFLTPIANSIDGMMPALLKLKTTGKVEDFVTWLKGDPKAQEKITLAFRKTVMLMSYLKSREKSLTYKVAYKYLAQKDASFTNKSEKDKIDMIKDILDDENFVKNTIDPVITQFRSKSVYEGIKFLDEYGCLDAKLDEFTQEAVDEVESRRKDLLEEDGDDDTIIDDIKSEFESGKLSKDGAKDLGNLVEDFEEEIDELGSKAWYNRYIPLMNLFDPSDEIMENIIQSGDYEKVTKMYKDKIVALKKKMQEGTVTQADIDELQQTINAYYSFQKSLAMSQTNIEHMVDDEGNMIVRIGSTIVQSGETLRSGTELICHKKYLKGGLMIAGAAISLDILTAPIRFFMPIGQLRKSPSVKAITFVSKKAIAGVGKLTGKTINMTTRNYMPSWIASQMYKGKDFLFRYELAQGNLSLEKGLKIAKKNNIRSRISGNIITTEDELIQWVAGIGNSAEDVKTTNILKKYRNNKNIMKQVISSEYTGKRYQITGKSEKYVYHLTPEFKGLESMDEFLKVCTHQGKASLIQGFMETTTTLHPEMIKELQMTKTFDGLSPKECESIGKLLGKKMHKFTSLEDFQKFQGYFFRNYTKYPSKTFVANSLSKRNKLQAMDEVAQGKYIESAKLNTSRYEKIASKVKTGVDKMIKDLNTMLKNPKLKTFYNSIKSKITNLTHYKNTVTAESVKAVNDAGRLDKVAGFGKLSDEGIQALKALNVLIKTDKTILEALSKASKLDDVKDILRQAGIAVDKIDDSVLMKIVSTKKIEKITSIINYGAEYTGIKTLKATLKNPALKSLGKWLGIVGVAIDVTFVGVDFATDIKDAKTIQQQNMMRGKNKEKEAYFDVITGGVGAAAFAVGLFLTTNPVGRVCLGAGFAAMGVEALGDMYYGEIDKFQQNYKDFLSQSVPEIKQRLIYINSRQTKLDSSFQDLRSKITGTMKAEEKQKFSMKTSQDAVKALIYFEEMQKYPYAMADLNDPEIRNNPDLESLVKQQKDLHDKAVNTRYAYIKKTYIDGKTSLVTKEDLDKKQGVQALDAILAESRICQAVQMDTTYPNKNNVKEYKNHKANTLKNMNAQGFTALENMYATNKLTFFKMVASIPYYQAMLSQNIEIQEYEKLTTNLDFFQQYANYKLMDIDPATYPTISINEQTIDYDQMTYLLSAWTMVVTKIQKEDIMSPNIEYLTDVDILEKYNVSTNLGQNVLYDIATMQLGYTGKNNLSELKSFYNEQDKTVKGIYFDPKHQDRAVNENNGSDNEFAKDKELNDPKKILLMREYIHDAAHTATTGKMIEMNYRLNREYVDQYVKIINQNLTYRLNPTIYKQKIFEYIQKNSNGQYIQLPPELIMMGIKTGVQNIGAFVYSRDGTKFDSKTSKPGIKNNLIV